MYSNKARNRLMHMYLFSLEKGFLCIDYYRIFVAKHCITLCKYKMFVHSAIQPLGAIKVQRFLELSKSPKS